MKPKLQSSALFFILFLALSSQADDELNLGHGVDNPSVWSYLITPTLHYQKALEDEKIPITRFNPKDFPPGNVQDKGTREYLTKKFAETRELALLDPTIAAVLPANVTFAPVKDVQATAKRISKGKLILDQGEDAFTVTRAVRGPNGIRLAHVVFIDEKAFENRGKLLVALLHELTHVAYKESEARQGRIPSLEYHREEAMVFARELASLRANILPRLGSGNAELTALAEQIKALLPGEETLLRKYEALAAGTKIN